MKKGIMALVLVILVFAAFHLYSSGKEEEIMEKQKKEETEIRLSPPREKGPLSLEECIKRRRSRRSYTPTSLSSEEISQLLWATQGITNERRGYRAAPSAGALYPIELYLVKNDGLYHYEPKGHKLRKQGSKDLRETLAGAAYGQRYVLQAPIDVVICAVYERVTGKYGERGVRYTHMEVGHAAQNLHLQAVALGLGSVPIGAFNDEEVSRILSLPKNQKPLYIIPVGHISEE